MKRAMEPQASRRIRGSRNTAGGRVTGISLLLSPPSPDGEEVPHKCADTSPRSDEEPLAARVVGNRPGPRPRPRTRSTSIAPRRSAEALNAPMRKSKIIDRDSFRSIECC